MRKNEPEVTGRRKYNLDELLAECDLNAPLPQIEGWDEIMLVGREILG